MPENASTRTTDRDRLRSRLVSPRSAGRGASAGVSHAGPPPSGTAQIPEAALHSQTRLDRSGQVEQSPVLFRLPAIASAEPGEVAAAFEPPHSEQFRGVQSEPHEMRSEDAVALDIARVEPQVHIQPPDRQAPSQPSPSQSTPSGLSEEDSEEGTTNQSQLDSRVETPQVESAQVVAAAPGIDANSQQKRTWWEHWSSGVVLILLVIALVVASIIALNDGGKVKPSQAAGQLEASMLDEFDLSSIAIPDISMPPLNATSERPLSTVAQNSPVPADIAVSPTPSAVGAEPATRDSATVELVAADNVSREETTVEAALVDRTASETTVVGKVALDGVVGEGTVVDLATVGEGVGSGLAGQAAPELAVQATAESISPLPLATLDRPTEVAAPQLFAPQELPSESGAVSDSRRISSLPASNPSVSLELPQTEAMRAEGASPTFYDGAALVGEQHTVSGSIVPGATGGLITPANNAAYGPHSYGPISSSAVGPVDTNMPNISTVLASATVSVSSGDAPVAQVTTSATPDLNGESIFEAYRRFQQLHQATTGPTSNRYPDPPPPH